MAAEVFAPHSTWHWDCLYLSVPFGPSTVSRDISPKMKHFLRNLREKLAKVIPHLIESQVSLRKIFSPWASLSLRGGTFIYIGISAKN